MRKLFLALALVSVLAFAGCKSTPATETPVTPETPATETPVTPTTPTTPAPAAETPAK